MLQHGNRVLHHERVPDCRQSKEGKMDFGRRIDFHISGNCGKHLGGTVGVKGEKRNIFSKPPPKSRPNIPGHHHLWWLFYIFRKKLKKVVKRAKVLQKNTDIISVSKKITSCGRITLLTNPRLFERGSLPKKSKPKVIPERTREPDGQTRTGHNSRR